MHNANGGEWEVESVNSTQLNDNENKPSNIEFSQASIFSEYLPSLKLTVRT